MLSIRLTVTKVEERTRIVSAHKRGEQAESVEEKYWCIVLDPGRIAIDLGKEEPADVQVGQKAKILIG